MSMSAILFFSREPQRSARPRAAAALIVAAANASSMDILRVTQARCITRGYNGESTDTGGSTPDVACRNGSVIRNSNTWHILLSTLPACPLAAR